jgi:membrane associated rhomboid family serine protease
VPQGIQRVTTSVRRASTTGRGAVVTKALIAANVLVALGMLAQGALLTRPGGDLYKWGALFITRVDDADGSLIGLSQGEWWRLLSSAFLHAGIIHLALNMYVLWILGAGLEEAMGRARFLLVYAVSGLAGSAGALLLSPTAITVGASGAVFGLFGAGFVLERQAGIRGGPVLGLIVINLAFTFLIPGISIGGHLGGLAGGALATLALARFGRGHALYGRLGAFGIAAVVAVGVLSIAVAYWQVGRYS